MSEAIKAAVIVLLLIALVVVAITVIYSIYDSRRTLRVGGHGPKIYNAATGPQPIREAALGSEARSVGNSDEVVRSRYLILGGIVGGALGVLFVKLWTMQVLNSDSYTTAAEENYTSTFTTRAVRGRIFDRNGVELVGNRATLAIMASSAVATDRNIIHRLSNVLGIPYNAVKERMSDTSEGAQADRVVTSDAPLRAVAFISEHPQIFSGISVEERTVRTYPQGDVAAHVLGYTGTISEEELASSTTADGNSYVSGDIVGKTGAESAFESVLQGVRGTKTVRIDAEGNVLSLIDQVKPQTGNDIRLTLDLDIQKVCESALVQSFTIALNNGYKNANGGSIVVLDLDDNGVLGMASYPTFSPAEFVAGVSDETWMELSSEASNYPLTNRAIAGQYPAASTFKVFGTMAALKFGYCDLTSSWTCTGRWTELGEEWAKNCWLLTGHGTVGIISGLAQSCDIVFYSLSLLFYENREAEPNQLQDDIEQWGFAAKTGIELEGEAVGRIPTAEWKAAYNVDAPENAQWNPGDMANFIIGQGDVLITPIQNAAAYSGIANGVIYTPHILQSVLDANGNAVITKQREVSHTPEYDDANLEIVRTALRKQADDNTSFSGFPYAHCGKTGTAQVTGKDDYGWYMAYFPADSPKYLIACIVEQGGGGGSCAAPTVRLVMDGIYGLSSDTVISDTAADETR